MPRQSAADATLKAFAENGGDELTAELREALAPDIQLLRPLGAGAMGLVFVGRDPLLKRLVAIKVLSPSLAGDNTARERFVRESEASAAVNHPNVAGIYLVGELPRSGIPYYVMQFIEGRTLADELRDGGMMSETRVKFIVGEVALALQAAHDKGVVHRDVKPANIMIETGSARPIVLDFGISAVFSGEAVPETGRLTTAGTYVGTPVYMSPEQATGEPVTGKSDVYGLGLIAFELLTGKPPFDGTPIVVMAAHVEKTPPNLHSLRPGIDDHLVQVVEQCLRKTPDQRPAAGDVARSLLPSGRLMLDWPPPGLDLVRGRGARLSWRWMAVCVALLLFFEVLYARPTTSSPEWRVGEQSLFWRGVTTPTQAFSNIGNRSLEAAQSATAIWLFLAGASMLLVLFAVFSAMMRTAHLVHQLRVARDDGYPWHIIFDAAWDGHSDTALVRNGAGIYALWSAERRATLLRARRARAVAGLITIALTLLMPVLWLSGALHFASDDTEILSGNEVLLMCMPLLAGMVVIAILDHRARSAIKERRDQGTRVHGDLVRTWLASAGEKTKNERSPLSRAFAGIIALGNIVAAVAIIYLSGVLLLVAFTTTTNLSNTRERMQRWQSQIDSDSAGLLHFSDLDAKLRRASLPSQGTAPDVGAARLLASRLFVQDPTRAVPAVMALDIAGARQVSGGVVEPEIPLRVRDIIGRDTLPSGAELDSVRKYATSPWLPVWHQLAVSPDLPALWQYRENLPDSSNGFGLPSAPVAGLKDVAARNTLSGIVLLSEGDVATATLRAKENIAVGRQLMRASTLNDHISGLVIVGIGRSLLNMVAVRTSNVVLAREAEDIRQLQMRASRLRLPGVDIVGFLAAPASREALTFLKAVDVPAYYSEMIAALPLGMCLNTHEVLFGTDPQREQLGRSIAAASHNPRSNELLQAPLHWMHALDAGTADLSNVSVPYALRPLGWLGLGKLRDRIVFCGR